MQIRTPTHRRTHYRGLWLTVAAIAGLLGALPRTLLAQEPDRKHERASISLGVFLPSLRSNTRLDSSSGSGTDVDLEGDLGLKSSSSVFRLGGYFWINDRHRLDFAYFDLSRDASVPIKRTINFGDKVFNINTVVQTKQALSIVKADYTFAILDRQRGFLGVTGGLYVLSSKLSLHEATIGTVETDGITAPLPLFGLRGDYKFGDKITLRGAAQRLQFASQNISGHFSDVYVGADYGFTKRMAVGIGYNKVAMNLSGTVDRGLSSQIGWGYDGATAYFKYDF